MGREVFLSLVILALALLPAAGTKSAVGYSNGEVVRPAPSSSMRLEDGVAPELGYSNGEVVRPAPSSFMRLEDGVAPELGVTTVVDLDVNGLLGANNISPGALKPTGPVCLVAPCVAGGPSSGGGRGCNPHYQCAVH